MTLGKPRNLQLKDNLRTVAVDSSVDSSVDSFNVRSVRGLRNSKSLGLGAIVKKIQLDW